MVYDRKAEEAGFREIRAAAHAAAEKLIGIDGLALRPIDAKAIGALDGWSNATVWEWPEIVQRYRKRPDRVEVAIWCDDRLCGLVIGRGRKKRVDLDLVEGARTGHPLKGHLSAIAIAVLETYARATSRTEVRLVEPLPALVARYTGYGYELVEPGGAERPYMVRLLDAV